MSEGAPAEVVARDFPCPGCGAPKMTFDAGAGRLTCEYCRHTEEVGVAEGERAIVEYDLEHGLAQATERGFGCPTLTLSCQVCGANVAFDQAAISTRCDFCDSPQVLQRASNPALIRPESLVPFSVERATATAQFAGWLGKLWFRPNDLKKQAKVGEINGVYIPYWTFDAHVDSSWTAQAGYYYYVTETYWDTDSGGKRVQRTRQARKVRWQPAWGSRSDDYDDVLVCASRGLPEQLAARLTSFDTSRLTSYDAGFLSGWRAEEYALELNDAWGRGVQKMETSQRARCSGDVPGDTQRMLNVTNRYGEETFKHVLLPIWIASYRYRDKPYRFLVNGQTGEVEGEAPLSWPKIIAFSMLIVAILAALFFATRGSSGGKPMSLSTLAPPLGVAAAPLEAQTIRSASALAPSPALAAGSVSSLASTEVRTSGVDSRTRFTSSMERSENAEMDPASTRSPLSTRVVDLKGSA